MTKEDLQKVLELHLKWLMGKVGEVRADLRDADLRREELFMAKGVMSFGPMPTSGRMIYAVRHDTNWMVQSGCFWGTLDELELQVKAEHNCPVYIGVISLLKNYNP